MGDKGCMSLLSYASNITYVVHAYKEKKIRPNSFTIQPMLKKLSSMAWVRERTIPNERPPLVGEVNANFVRIDGVVWSARRIPTAVFSVFHEAEGAQLQTHYLSETLVTPGIELEPLDL
jgi:hypothetical protein